MLDEPKGILKTPSMSYPVRRRWQRKSKRKVRFEKQAVSIRHSLLSRRHSAHCIKYGLTQSYRGHTMNNLVFHSHY